MTVDKNPIDKIDGVTENRGNALVQYVKGYKCIWRKKRSWNRYKKKMWMPIYQDIGPGGSKDGIWFSMHRNEKGLE